ncbi:hypothetical protein J6590_008051 [Homalodisca vitripennis]|nr:hypothetical protein J6590_008051 [Homalodisca vitripennis]
MLWLKVRVREHLKIYDPSGTIGGRMNYSRFAPLRKTTTTDRCSEHSRISLNYKEIPYRDTGNGQKHKPKATKKLCTHYNRHIDPRRPLKQKRQWGDYPPPTIVW